MRLRPVRAPGLQGAEFARNPVGRVPSRGDDINCLPGQAVGGPSLAGVQDTAALQKNGASAELRLTCWRVPMNPCAGEGDLL